jgi:chemotaxis protein CheC
MLRLTEQQVGDFKELGNVGSGFAASQLADLIGQRCLIGIPSVFALSGETLQELAGAQDDFAVSIDVRARGDFESCMYVIMKAFSAERIIREMAKVESKKSGTLVDLKREYELKKLGESLVQSYMSGVNGFLQTESILSPPEVIVDLYNKALDRTLRRLLQIDGEQILIHTAFTAPDESFDGTFALILNRTAQFNIITKLGQMTNSY